MNNKQQNKITMFEAVANVMKENQARWQKIKALEEAYGEFTELMVELRNKGTQRSKDTTGVTLNKKQKKELMAKKASLLAGSAYAYAGKIKNIELQRKFDYNFSFLKKADDNNAFSLVKAITEEAGKLMPQLIDYGVEEGEIEEVIKLAEDFKNHIGEKAHIKSGRVAATLTLGELFDEISLLLSEQIDLLMRRFEDKEPEFYRTYQNARTIGGRSGNEQGGEGSENNEIISINQKE